MKVLVVDDDLLACKMLRYLLVDDGYAVQCAHRADIASEIVGREEIDLVLLDVMLPAVDGFQAFRDLRRGGYGGPVIFLSAATDTSDKLTGLEMGADDYVIKPFEPQELVARVNAVLRRHQQSRLPSHNVQVQAGHVVLDVNALRIRMPNGRTATLTRTEMKVVQCLMNRPGVAVPREVIAKNLWGSEQCGREDQISVYVRRLRKKIEPDPEEPRYIESVRAIGYRFSAE